MNENKKISLKNLFVVKVSNSNTLNISEIIIAKRKNNYFKDIITGTLYPIYYDSKINIKKLPFCFDPISIMSLPFNSADSLSILINNGYIAQKGINIIYKEINNALHNYIQGDLINLNEFQKNYLNINNMKKKENNNIVDSEYGTIINDKYNINPTFGREKEMLKVIQILASLKKNPILVGKSGVGKTAIVDKLAYNIKINNVPNFISNKKILEITSSEFVAGTKFRGQFEEKFTKIMNYAKSENCILFIDEIHEIFISGSCSDDEIHVANFLRNAIDRENIKIIGSTTDEEYNEFFNNQALKRRFSKIIVEEPQGNLLYNIILNTLENYSNYFNISINNLNIEKIIDILINLTEQKNRNILDLCNNPDLVIGIIDNAFGQAKANNQDNLNIENLNIAILNEERIYPNAKEKAINQLSYIETNVQEKTKVIKINQ